MHKDEKSVERYKKVYPRTLRFSTLNFIKIHPEVLVHTALCAYIL
jgi:hypothetical protein